MNELFEFLNSNDLTPKKCQQALSKLDSSAIQQIIEFALSLNNSAQKDDSSKFNFIANRTLAGGTFPCHEETCRLRNLDMLARNSILYADTVYIESPFEKYAHVEQFGEYARYLLHGDILLLNHVRPLLEEGIFKFTESFHHICKDCLRETKAITKAYEKKIEKAESFLLSSMFKEYTFVLRLDEEKVPYIAIDGPSDLFEHPSAIYFYEEKNQLLKKIGKKQRALKKEEIIDLGLKDMLVDPIIDDLLTQNYYSNLNNSSYLTNRDIDSKLILENQNKNVSAFNKNLTQSLSHNIPFVSNIDLKKLINLRKKEGEAFQVYRTSFTSFLLSMKDTNYNLKEAFNDEIQPEINKMNQTIKTSKKLIMSDIAKDVIVGSTFVSVGLFANFLPPNIGQIVAGVGGAGYLGKFGDNIKKLRTVETDIRNNKYFFIWKLLKQNN